MPWKDLGKVVGDDGKIGNVDSTYINNGGDPGVTITRSGEDVAPDFTFEFENLVNDPLTESELEQIVGGAVVGSSHVVNGTVLSNFMRALSNVFAAKNHKHSTSDVTSGQFGQDQIADGAVTADKLADGSVGIAHLDEEMAAGWESLSQTLSDTGWVDLYYIAGKIRIRARRVGRIVTITGESIGYYDIGGSKWVNLNTVPQQFRPSKRTEVAFNLAENVQGGVRSYLEEAGEFYVFCTASACSSWGCISTYVV